MEPHPNLGAVVCMLRPRMECKRWEDMFEMPEDAEWVLDVSSDVEIRGALANEIVPGLW